MCHTPTIDEISIANAAKNDGDARAQGGQQCARGTIAINRNYSFPIGSTQPPQLPLSEVCQRGPHSAPEGKIALRPHRKPSGKQTSAASASHPSRGVGSRHSGHPKLSLTPRCRMALKGPRSIMLRDAPRGKRHVKQTLISGLKGSFQAVIKWKSLHCCFLRTLFDITTARPANPVFTPASRYQVFARR
jgi:hypothetical protein